MWNRFRLWLNKNDSKIITVALCIIGFFIIIKGSNSVLRERFLEEKSKEESENTNSVFEDTELSKDNLSGLDKLSDEYKSANTVTKKIIRAI